MMHILSHFYLRALRQWPVIFLIIGTLCFDTAACARTAGPHLRARAALAIDLSTGRQRYASHADEVMPIASLTKLMTAMVVLDAKPSMLRPLRVTDDDVDRLKWSKSRLPVHSLLLRRTLLHIALMSSENRAAFALSRYYQGGRPAFIRAMNRKAQALGMRHSHFVDPTGLSPGNAASARDVARMARAALHYPTIRHDTTSHRQTVLGGEGPLLYRNSNALVFYKGWHLRLQKTGFTNEAGHCLIVVTPVRGHIILMVILGAPDDRAHIEDAARLRDWLVSPHLAKHPIKHRHLKKRHLKRRRAHPAR